MERHIARPPHSFRPTGLNTFVTHFLLIVNHRRQPATHFICNSDPTAKFANTTLVFIPLPVYLHNFVWRQTRFRSRPFCSTKRCISASDVIFTMLSRQWFDPHQISFYSFSDFAHTRYDTTTGQTFEFLRLLLSLLAIICKMFSGLFASSPALI